MRTCWSLIRTPPQRFPSTKLWMATIQGHWPFLDIRPPTVLLGRRIASRPPVHPFVVDWKFPKEETVPVFHQLSFPRIAFGHLAIYPLYTWRYSYVPSLAKLVSFVRKWWIVIWLNAKCKWWAPNASTITSLTFSSFYLKRAHLSELMSPNRPARK